VPEGRAAPLLPWVAHHCLCPSTFPPLRKGWLPWPPQSQGRQLLEGQCWLGSAAASAEQLGEGGR